MARKRGSKPKPLPKYGFTPHEARTMTKTQQDAFRRAASRNIWSPSNIALQVAAPGVGSVVAGMRAHKRGVAAARAAPKRGGLTDAAYAAQQRHKAKLARQAARGQRKAARAKRKGRPSRQRRDRAGKFR